MDTERQKRLRRWKVILTEALMVLAVVVIAMVAIFLAMGFSLNQKGGIDQSGLLQLRTLPAGATVQLDDDVLFLRSNLSQTVLAGEHRIKLTKEDYDSWEKRISMTAGWLLRVHYPRLFLQERKPEKVISMDKKQFFSPAKGRDYVLHADLGSTKWQLTDVEGEIAKTQELDLTNFLLGSGNNKEVSKVKIVQWNDNGDKVLAKVWYGEQMDWVLVNLKMIEGSINLTQEFGMDFTEVKIADAAADQLIVCENNNVRKIDTLNKVVSQVLIKNVTEFNNMATTIAYVTKPNKAGEQTIGTLKDGEKGSVIIDRIKQKEVTVHVALSSYYDDDYVFVTVGQQMRVFYGKLPSYESTFDDMSVIMTTELKEIPLSLEVSGGGEYGVARRGKRIMVADVETRKFQDYIAPTEAWQWLDSGMMYGVVQGKLLVWDFDGANQRELSKKALEQAVIISSDNKYLYYINDKAWLVKERIMR